MGKLLRKFLRRAIVTARDLAREATEEREDEHDHDKDDFAYCWLNSVWMKLMADEDGALRPHFAWGVLQSVHLAKAIGINRVSVIEFGVAGGNGIISLEKVAQKVEPLFQVKIDVYGFDTGGGLPKPQDHRDLPNLWRQGAFPMDFEKLQKRLTKTQLVLGMVEDTIPRFVHSDPAPVAFISFDLDYYSSTLQALKLFEANPAVLLPRIHCYFDDILGFTYSDYTGERLAIAEFNSSHDTRKISPIYGLKYFLPAPYNQVEWSESFFMAHIFDHELYGRPDGLVKRGIGSSTDLRPE